MCYILYIGKGIILFKIYTGLEDLIIGLMYIQEVVIFI
jgi:hypothetical protein